MARRNAAAPPDSVRPGTERVRLPWGTTRGRCGSAATCRAEHPAEDTINRAQRFKLLDGPEISSSRTLTLMSDKLSIPRSVASGRRIPDAGRYPAFPQDDLACAS